jgi:hypothetical protein
MKRIVAAVVCAAIPALCLAESPRYTYLEAGYQALDLDDPNVDGDGFGLGGSLALNERLYLRAGYSDLDMDFGVDVSSYEFGIGGNLPMSDDLHLVGEVGYTETELDASNFDIEDDGYYLSGGFRWMATEALEVNALLSYVDMSDSGDETSLTVGGLYNLTADLAVGVGASWSDDAMGYSAGLRYYFPGRN